MLLIAKLQFSSNTTTLILTLSSFNIVKHLKSDLRSYIEYLDM